MCTQLLLPVSPSSLHDNEAIVFVVVVNLAYGVTVGALLYKCGVSVRLVTSVVVGAGLLLATVRSVLRK